MVDINTFNIVSQNLFTKFVNQNDIDSSIVSIVGEFNIHTSGSSLSAILPDRDFYNILPGAIIVANQQTRYVLSKHETESIVSLDSEVDWNNFGNGYSFTYSNPISQILNDSQTLIGYLTSDRRIYLLNYSGATSTTILDNESLISPTNELKLLSSTGYGLHVDSNGDMYMGNDVTDTWVKVGTLRQDALTDYISKSTDNVSDCGWVLDQDNMSSNTSEKVATQQSVKTYVEEKQIDGGNW